MNLGAWQMRPLILLTLACAVPVLANCTAEQVSTRGNRLAATGPSPSASPVDPQRLALVDALAKELKDQWLAAGIGAEAVETFLADVKKDLLAYRGSAADQLLLIPFRAAARSILKSELSDAAAATAIGVAAKVFNQLYIDQNSNKPVDSAVTFLDGMIEALATAIQSTQSDRANGPIASAFLDPGMAPLMTSFPGDPLVPINAAASLANRLGKRTADEAKDAFFQDLVDSSSALVELADLTDLVASVLIQSTVATTGTLVAAANAAMDSTAEKRTSENITAALSQLDSVSPGLR
jgi:hypothetical protein